jgi:putative transposase
MSALIAVEELNVKAMTASGGAHKKGLNREILNTSPSALNACLKYKAEEADTKWHEIPTRKVKPTQTCSGCGKRQKKTLAQRQHDCPECQLQLSRDQNSARVILNWALVGNATGKGLSSCGETICVSEKQETPSITTSVV